MVRLEIGINQAQKLVYNVISFSNKSFSCLIYDIKYYLITCSEENEIVVQEQCLHSIIIFNCIAKNKLK